ncbi:MAG: hypothetical protein WDN29_02830 [Methylovirgula sp.]
MPNQLVRATATGLPTEPAFTLTDAGRAYLLLEDIAAASVDLPPDIAAELTALTAGGCDHV